MMPAGNWEIGAYAQRRGPIGAEAAGYIAALPGERQVRVQAGTIDMVRRATPAFRRHLGAPFTVEIPVEGMQEGRVVERGGCASLHCNAGRRRAVFWCW